MSKLIRSQNFGCVNLAGSEGALFKRTLLCHTGSFQGMYGPVEVTAERLNRIAELNNRLRAKPANEFDYVPVTKNHDRTDVDKVMGRVLGDLEVQDWIDPETDLTEKGLYGTIRIDDDAAKLKVEKGLYSQVSISFDEETDELYEVSFVAVEAARRSQVLSKGENMDIALKLKNLTLANDGMIARVRTLASARKEVCLAFQNELSSSQAEISSVTASLLKATTSIKVAALSAEFKRCVREGKMSKAEFDGLKMNELAALPEAGSKALLKSYMDRSPSTDIVQHGQTGAQPIDFSKVSPAQMRALTKAQLSGKPAKVSLAEGDDGEDKEKKKDKKDGEGASESELSVDDVSEATKALSEIGSMIEKLTGHVGKMSESLKKLMASDEKDPTDEQPAA